MFIYKYLYVLLCRIFGKDYCSLSYIYVYIYIYACIYIYIYIHICSYINIYMYLERIIVLWVASMYVCKRERRNTLQHTATRILALFFHYTMRWVTGIIPLHFLDKAREM